MVTWNWEEVLPREKRHLAVSSDGVGKLIGNGEEGRNQHSAFPGLSKLMTDLQMGKTWKEIDFWLKGEKFNKLAFGYVIFKIPLGHHGGHADILKYGSGA